MNANSMSGSEVIARAMGILNAIRAVLGGAFVTSWESF